MDKRTGKIIFGPVPSRRLGRSLGVDILPLKSCNLNCIYCELGPTSKYTLDRISPVAPSEIEAAFLEFLREGPQPFDVVTITASGEPTLHRDLGQIVEVIKRHSPRPVALLTNSTLLNNSEVRYAIKEIDILLPSLDAGLEATFKRINRPAKGVEFEEVLQGLTTLRDSYRGRVLLEILFVKGVNDSKREISRLKEIIEEISPDEIQVGTIARPPAEPWAHKVDRAVLERIASIFGDRARVVTSFSGPSEGPGKIPSEEEIIELLKRRPLNRDDVHSLFHPFDLQVLVRLQDLVRKGLIRKEVVEAKEFFCARDQ